MPDRDKLMFKSCISCGAYKSLSNYSLDRYSSDYRKSKCKKCCSKYAKTYYLKNKKQIKEDRDSPWGKYKNYKTKAKQRGLTFSLTFLEFKQFWQKSCNYCGSAIDTIGLDRKNNRNGYILSNVISCCITCNTMKSDLSKKVFFSHIKKIVSYIGEGENYAKNRS